ncbi:alpha,alpha-trehalose phosphorylase [Jatrophihabitans sp. GAS493]|uniref:glycoside hydrolase family 65 protein n=1 Tax=Jatrophihabitans sp. GAS493 TaxID=1907575 RepID=UPI000BB78BBB|nr:glycosyl hydrolase family 65 protein [Jatrophihabitans sp. GAS493]SOD72791.1 alpha,alpha-trehalose phosphorylase [Jatrophihabitans sp. GAS493]
MIIQPQFPVEPWVVRETSVNLDHLAQAESIFALANGHIGVRGNFDEGEPYGLPGSYLSSFYEQQPLPYAEAGYGYPESGQSIVNITNGKLIRLVVDDEAFDLRYGTILSHERLLDLRTGLLQRDVHWRSPAGKEVRVRSTRLVSFTRRSIMAINYQVEALDSAVRIVLQSELVANEEMPTRSADPRVAAVLENPLEAQEHSSDGSRFRLLHNTRRSQLRIAAGMDHLVGEVQDPVLRMNVEPDWARMTIGAHLEPGQRLQLTKFVAYSWSSQRSVPALRDQVDAALASAMATGWRALADEQRAYLDDFWAGADVEVEGAPELQQAVRFGLWHVLQAAARSELRAVAAKGLTGTGYDGHAFWDTEMFVLPVLTATAPQASADALRWRHSTLDLARDRAKTLSFQGAAFPWRTIAGQECSAYWPAGTAAFHINAAVAVAAARHLRWSGDLDFGRGCALEVAVETARLWMSLGFYGMDGRFHLDGVTGPDEYSAVADDNVYTNLMAARNLRFAADVARRWPTEAEALGVTVDEVQSWRSADEAMAVPYNEQLQVHEQSRDFTAHAVLDFQRAAATGSYPLLLHWPYFDLYRKQVVKQADLVLALHWCGDSFTAEEKARDFAYYEALTVRDSSLSACTQSIVAAEVGQLELAYDYLMEAALTDLDDLEHNTSDGMHIASLAGTWLGIVCGFGGLRDHSDQLAFAPRLPDGLTRLAFRLRWRGSVLRVTVTPDAATYEADQKPDEEIALRHHGQSFTLTSTSSVTLPIDAMPRPGPRPTQPAGRAPVRREAGESE